MSCIASSRLIPRISAFSFSTASLAATAASSSPAGASAAAAASNASSSAGDPSSLKPPAASRPWTALRFAAVSAALGTTGYVSYTCSLEEVDQMTRELRKNSKRPIPEDASGFQFLLLLSSCTWMLGAKLKIKFGTSVNQYLTNYFQIWFLMSNMS